MEVTKWLKPSGSRVTIYGDDSASVQAVTRVNAEQASKRTMRRPTRLPYRGRLARPGEVSKADAPSWPGYWRQTRPLMSFDWGAADLNWDQI